MGLPEEAAFFNAKCIPKTTESTNVSRCSPTSAHGRPLTTPESQKQHKCPSTDDCIKKKCGLACNGRLRMKNNEILISTTKGMKTLKVVLSKLRVSVALYCGLKK